jgi:hypothetical protein
MKRSMTDSQGWQQFNVPNTPEGLAFIETLKQHLNHTRFRVQSRGRGKRPNKYLHDHLPVGMSQWIAVYIRLNDRETAKAWRKAQEDYGKDQAKDSLMQQAADKLREVKLQIAQREGEIRDLKARIVQQNEQLAATKARNVELSKVVVDLRGQTEFLKECVVDQTSKLVDAKAAIPQEKEITLSGKGKGQIVLRISVE